MAIKIKVSDWLGKKKMSQADLAKATGIRPATVSALYHERVKRLEVDQLNAMCRVLGCQPGDLLVYEEDTKTEK